jgi:AhpD family alkylhydroperoxidase
MAHLPSLPEGATLLDVFKAFPETNKPLIEFHEALLRGPSPFSEAERESIAAYVSGINRCRYCHGVHAATAERLGASEDAVPPRMQPVLDYAAKLTRDPAAISKSDADAVYAAGWDETAL